MNLCNGAKGMTSSNQPDKANDLTAVLQGVKQRKSKTEHPSVIPMTAPAVTLLSTGATDEHI